MSLFEHLLFDILLKIRQSNSQELGYFIPDETLIVLDPIFPKLEGTINTNHSMIRGETLFEHELQHSFATPVTPDGKTYVIIRFARIIHNKKQYLVLKGNAIHSKLLSKSKYVEALLAPRNPSSGDYNEIIKVLTELSHEDNYDYISELNLLMEKANYPKNEFGTVLPSSIIDALFLKHWRKKRKLKKIE